MKEKIIEVNDIHICTESFGKPSDPVILLIMGAMSSMIYWDEEFCQRLADTGRYVIRFDNRDVGRSTTYEPGTSHYTVEDMANDAVGVLQAYRIDHAHLVGMSLGGMIAQIVAVHHSEKVLTMTLLASGLYGAKDKKKDLPSMDKRILSYHAKAKTLDWTDEKAVIDYLVQGSRLLCGSRHTFDEERVHKQAATEVKRANHLPSMFNHALLQGGNDEEKWQELHVPTLVIHGTEDSVLPYENALALTEEIPNTTLLTLKGTGHELHADDWETIINAITHHTSLVNGSLPLSDEQVIKQAREYGLVLQADSFKGNDSGLDFRVLFAEDADGEKWVLRLPRREDVISTAKKEKRILDVVSPKFSIQVPKWHLFSDRLIAYKLLKGVPAGTIDPEAKKYIWEIDEQNVPDAFYQTLGKAMAELHSIPHAEAEKAGLDVKKPDELRSSMKARMEKVKSEYGVSVELWERWQQWLANDPLWPEQTSLIHGDLHPGHILIDEEARVTGMIDWTEARVDDTSHDFVVHYSAFGEAALKKLIHQYEKSGGYVWPSMFQHIVELVSAYPVAIAEFAMKSGLQEYERYARHALGVES